MRKLLIAVAVSLFLSSTAYAHFNLTMPAPATTSTTGGKGIPPCGEGPASNMISPAQGGHPLAVRVNEFVGHDGWYRIALSINARAELPLDSVVHDAAGKVLPPDGSIKGTSATADFEATPKFPVLADHIWVHTAGAQTAFQMDITLPNVTCTKCTLQVVEFMAGHGYNTDPNGGPGGGYFYHHCADLKITADPALPPFDPAGGDGGATDAAADGGTVKDAPAETGGGTGGTTMGSGGASGSGGATAGSGGSGSGGASSTGGRSGAGGSAGQSGGGGGGGGCSLASRPTVAANAVWLLLALVVRRRRRS